MTIDIHLSQQGYVGVYVRPVPGSELADYVGDEAKRVEVWEFLQRNECAQLRDAAESFAERVWVDVFEYDDSSFPIALEAARSRCGPWTRFRVTICTDPSFDAEEVDEETTDGAGEMKS